MVRGTFPNSKAYLGASISKVHEQLYWRENGKYTSTENFVILAQSTTFCCIANVQNGEVNHEVLLYYTESKAMLIK